MESPYDKHIAEYLNISLEYFQGVVSRMKDEDWQMVYFLSGKMIADKKNMEIRKEIEKIISKYNRKEKILKILKK